MSYEKCHVKRNPETGEVALRTQFPEDRTPRLAGMAWLISTPNIGSRHARTDEVEGWDDLWVPPSEAQDEEPVAATPSNVPLEESPTDE